MKNYIKEAKEIRRNIVKMVYDTKAAHIGSALSVVDILTVLYFDILKFKPENPQWSGRDRLVFSKGHAAAALYATLVQRGVAPEDCLKDYYADGTKLAAHPVLNCLPGVECSTGSLGHGLSIGLGMSMANKYNRNNSRVFVILSEGDCNEGSNWEAAMMASQLKLDNLIVIVDYNKIQAMGRSEDIMDLEPFKDKWESFGWTVQEIDGHDYALLEKTLNKVPFIKEKPIAIIAHTIKGRGVSFMEDTLAWHYQAPDEEQFKQALKELE